MRSSAAFRRLTLPISRRYSRTGSSIISTLLISCFQLLAELARVPSWGGAPLTEDAPDWRSESVARGSFSSSGLKPSSRFLVRPMRSAAEVLAVSPRRAESEPSPSDAESMLSMSPSIKGFSSQDSFREQLFQSGVDGLYLRP